MGALYAYRGALYRASWDVVPLVLEVDIGVAPPEVKWAKL